MQEVSTVKPNAIKYAIMSHLLVNLKKFSADAAKFLPPVITMVKFFQQRTRVV